MINLFCHTSKYFGDSTDTDRRPHVNMPDESGTSGVVPILVVWSQLIEFTILNDIDPLGNLKFTASAKINRQNDINIKAQIKKCRL